MGAAPRRAQRLARRAWTRAISSDAWLESAELAAIDGLAPFSSEVADYALCAVHEVRVAVRDFTRSPEYATLNAMGKMAGSRVTPGRCCSACVTASSTPASSARRRTSCRPWVGFTLGEARATELIPAPGRGRWNMKEAMRASLLVLLLVGCVPRVGPALTDGGSTDGDAGVVVGCDNSTLDGDETDVDCGGSCAGCAVDLACDGPRDCASGVCLSGRCRAPANPCAAAYAGCTTFVDLTDAGTPTIRFPVGGDAYSPACVRVRLGQSVLFSGNLSSHPLAQGCGPVNDLLNGTSGTSASFGFTSALGVFGYYCTRHGSQSGSGMAGAIEVVR